ncbi:HAD-IIB family hydrolase [Lysinibacillus sp. NPDC097287]|uniref:HAD-IIB family hydrolase n=1 Tax=Lysinibacillus sp. NPDC097287 TaxID=3364144 RepID=UPI003829BEB9
MKFVFDLDGTICFKGQPLSVNIIVALENCITNGHEVIFASARPIRDLLPVLPKAMQRFPMVGGNGAFVANESELIAVTAFKTDIVAQIRGLISTYKLPYLVDGNWDYAYTGSEAHPIYRNLDPLKLAKKVTLEELQEIVKVVLFPGELHKEVWEALKKLPISLYEHTSENIIDMSPSGIDKWNGLTKLGVVEGEFIAFGNDANDRSMFAKAKESVCVGEHPVREFATLQVASTEDAVAAIICSFSEKYK